MAGLEGEGVIRSDDSNEGRLVEGPNHSSSNAGTCAAWFLCYDNSCIISGICGVHFQNVFVLFRFHGVSTLPPIYSPTVKVLKHSHGHVKPSTSPSPGFTNSCSVSVSVEAAASRPTVATLSVVLKNVGFVAGAYFVTI